MLLHLVTHAHTRQEPAVDARGWVLSEMGVQQAQALAEAAFWADVEQVVISSEPKTRLTAQPVVARYGLPVRMDARLDELRRVGWIEAYGETVRQVFAHPQRSIGGWESAADAQTRCVAAVDDLMVRFAGGNVAIVGHGLTLSLLRAWYLGQKTVDWDAWNRLPFGAWATLDLSQPRGGHVLLQDFCLGEPSR